MFTISIRDDETLATIRKVYEKHQVLLEPHGAVGWKGLMEYFNSSHEEAKTDQVAVSLETAHPAKFPEEIQKILGIDPELPQSLKGLDDKEEQMLSMGNDYQLFKEYLKKNYL